MDYQTKERILKNMLIEITKKYDYIVGDYKSLEFQYKERLLKDYLTRLLNRDRFIKEFKQLQDRYKKENINLALLLIDFGDFKYISSFYGRDIGDMFIIH